MALWQGKVLTSLTAPEAVLSEIVIGNKTSEIQILDLVGFDRVRLSTEGQTGYTEVLDVATLTPEALATALGSLPAVGASSNVVVSTTETANIFRIEYIGGLAKLDMALLTVSPVQRMSLIQPDGQMPTSIMTRVASASDWSTEINVRGMAADQIAAVLKAQLDQMPNYARSDIVVSIADEDNLTFDIA